VELARFENSPVGRLVRIAGVDGRTMTAYEHAAFVPDPLDGEPELAGATWRQVARAGYALGRLQQAGRQVPAPELLRRPTLRREAQSTSALEGTFAPLQDVLAADLTALAGRSGELSEVLNYIEAAEAAFEWMADGRPVTVSMLSELHRVLVRGTSADNDEAGRVRQLQVVIGSPTESLADARYIPPPPGPGLESALHDLVSWLTDRPSRSRDPIVAAAMGHYQFEALHPFNDGNGRIGRLMVVLQLLQDDVLSEPLLSVSPWFERRRGDYQDRLAAVSADGDWDGWISFFAAGLEASAIDTAHRVDRLLAVQGDYLQRVRAAGVAGLARDITETLIAYPYLTVRAVAERTGKTFQAANTAVSRLVELGVLTERTGRSQGRLFEASAVVDVLTAPAP
jgi:Fic family protein